MLGEAPCTCPSEVLPNPRLQALDKVRDPDAKLAAAIEACKEATQQQLWELKLKVRAGLQLA